MKYETARLIVVVVAVGKRERNAVYKDGRSGYHFRPAYYPIPDWRALRSRSTLMM